MSYVRTQLATVVRWEARDQPGGQVFTGTYDVVTRDIGGTIGVDVYTDGGDTLIRSFYAHTRHVDTARDIARDIIQDTVARIRADYGARNIAREFAETFPRVVYEAGYNDLDPSHLSNTPLGG